MTVRVCFVCLGNICRSPTAEAVMAHLVEEAGLDDEVVVESAGTASWHEGEAPDPRATAEVSRRGLTMRSVGQCFRADDFERFDLVVAMDAKNRRHLVALAPHPDAAAKVHLMRDFDPASAPGLDVPDPYYDADDGFRRVFDLVDAACRGLLDHVVEAHVAR